jgi:PBP1b-binding outer membrane lipoprotein LpoB
MNRFCLLILVSFLLVNCKNQPHEEVQPEKKEEKNNFFPLQDFIRGEITNVDSLPIGILKYSVHDNKTDSSYIKPAEFNRLAQEFLPPELDSNVFKREFSESSFYDETTKSLTFTYSTKNKSLQLQRADILATLGDRFAKVKSVYMENVDKMHDTNILKKMFWQAGKSFQVISSINRAGKASGSSQMKVVWDY